MQSEINKGFAKRILTGLLRPREGLFTDPQSDIL
jgi:hypothetical protein